MSRRPPRRARRDPDAIVLPRPYRALTNFPATVWHDQLYDPFTDRDKLLNWIGDPLGSTADWIIDTVTPLFRTSATVEVPDVVGELLLPARQRLVRAGLRVKVFGEIEPGLSVVASQNPPPGYHVPRKSTVALSIERRGVSYAAGPG